MRNQGWNEALIESKMDGLIQKLTHDILLEMVEGKKEKPTNKKAEDREIVGRFTSKVVEEQKHKQSGGVNSYDV